MRELLGLGSDGLDGSRACFSLTRNGYKTPSESVPPVCRSYSLAKGQKEINKKNARKASSKVPSSKKEEESMRIKKHIKQ